MPAERVVIDIEVNSDIATIEATREALDRLTNAQRRYNRERDRGRGGSGGGSGDDDDGGSGGGGRGGRRGGGGGGGGGRYRGRGNRNGRYDGLGGQVFDFRGDMGKGIASYGQLLGMVNKLSAIALPAFMAALSGISLAFKAGTYFLNMYKAAMASMASAVAVGFIALTTFLAAQKEFSAVQNSPAYFEGTVNSTDRMVAAGQAMSYFTDNTRLAVVGAKGLQAAFSTLSKVKPVDGQTTAAFEGLMNVVAGSGGDIEKGAGKLADFLAAVQKKGSLAGGAQAAKDLGPDFEKIVKEAGALGIKTSDEFLKAAADGKLGETFAKKYAGTLDALNNTVMGRFKSAVTSVKGLLTDLGGQYLGETGGSITRLQHIIEGFIVRLNYVMQDFSIEGKMGGFLDKVEKGTNALIVLMTKYLGATPNIFQFFNKSVMSIRDVFDGMQDFMRTLSESGALINEYFFKPLFSSLGTNFTSSMTSLSDAIERNKDSITSLAQQISKTLTAMGKYGDTVRQLIIGALPLFEIIFKMVEMFFKGLTLFGKAALTISSAFQKLGHLGKVAGALVNVMALYSLFTLATRFFKVFGTMFGKKMDKNMNITAGTVYVNGSPMGGPMGAGGAGAAGQMSAAGHMSPYQRMQSFSRSQTAGGNMSRRQMMQSYGRQANAKFGGFGTMLAGGALLMGGGMLSSQGDEMGGYDTAGGTVMKAVGTTAQIGGTGAMLLGKDGLTALGKGSTMAGAGVLAGGAAIIGGSYAAGSYIGGKFNDDSIKSKGTSALAGAASGAVIGAVIGNVVPIIGPAVGAALGAVVGGIVAWRKAGAQRKATQKAATALVTDYTNAVDDAISGGNVEDLLKARDTMLANKDKIIGENADPAYAAKAVAKYDKEFAALNTRINMYSSNAGLAQQFLGIGAEQLNKFAKDKGISLEDKLLDLRDVIKIVSSDTAEQARLMKAAWANIGAAAVAGSRDYFTDKNNAAEQSKLVDSTQAKILTGDTSEKTLDTYLGQMRDFSVSSFGDIGGLANVAKTLEEELTTGSFKDLSDEKKAYLRAEAEKAGLTGTSMLKNIDGTQLAGLLGNSKALMDLGLGYTGTDEALKGKLDPKLLMKYISGKQLDDPAFLANLITASQEIDTATAERKITQVINTGSAVLTPGMDSEEQRMINRFGGQQVPVPVVSDNYAVNMVINAAMIDKTTIDQIERQIAKVLREQKERGPSVGVSGNGGKS